MLELIVRTCALAAKAHSHQRRLGGEPFFNHPMRVAERVTNLLRPEAGLIGIDVLTPYSYSEVIAGAVAHDMPEDQPQFNQELHDLNPLVYDLAVHLRNPSKDHPELPRAKRKKMDREHVWTMPAAAVIIKFVDRWDNLQSIGDFRSQFRADYIYESELLAETLNKRLGEFDGTVTINTHLTIELVAAIEKAQSDHKEYVI